MICKTTYSLIPTDFLSFSFSKRIIFDKASFNLILNVAARRFYETSHDLLVDKADGGGGGGGLGFGKKLKIKKEKKEGGKKI